MKKVTRKTANKIVKLLEHNADNIGIYFLHNKTIPINKFIDMANIAINNTNILLSSAKNPQHYNNGFQDTYIISDTQVEITVHNLSECKDIILNLENKITEVKKIIKRIK